MTFTLAKSLETFFKMNSASVLYIDILRQQMHKCFKIQQERKLYLFQAEKKTVDETIPITQIPKLLFYDRGRLFNHIIRDTLLRQSYDLSFGSLSSSGI